MVPADDGAVMVSNNPLMAEQLCPSDSDKLRDETRTVVAANSTIITAIDLFHMMMAVVYNLAYDK